MKLPRLLLLAALAGCAESPLPSGLLEPEAEPLLSLVSSECGGRTALRDSRIDLTWPGANDGTSAIRSDGKGEYRGGENGVHGKIFYHDSSCSRSADAVFDPDFGSSRTPRTISIHFPENDAGIRAGAVAVGPFMNFVGIMRLGSDVTSDESQPEGRDRKLDEKNPGSARSLEHPETAVTRPNYPEYNPEGRRFALTTGIRGCERLEYTRITMTRTAGRFDQLPGQRSSDGRPVGEWSGAAADRGTFVVASSGDHTAQCLREAKGTFTPNGSPMFMPFSVTIVERRI